MNIILKNFFFVLRRFKTASFLNITGLSIAFAAFMIIMIQVQYEWGFDKFHNHADRIYRIDMPRSANDQYASALTRGFADDVMQSSPHIEAASLVCSFMGKSYVAVGEGSAQKGYYEKFFLCYPDLTKIFDFEMVEGDRHCLTAPEKVLISQSMAHRMFGNEPAVGKTIYSQESIWLKGDIRAFTVGGVYKDFPENTQLDNTIYTNMDKSFSNDWNGMNFMAYVLLDNPQAKAAVEDNYNAITDFAAHNKGEEARMELIPLTDIYYKPGQITDFIKSGNPNTTRLLFLIALLVIVIACINFINFNTALAPTRMKSINTQKVLGSSVHSLRCTLISEAVGISLLACLLAYFLIWGLSNTEALSFLIADVDILKHIPLAAMMLVLSVVLGIASGLYPSWYMTSFPPALVLKGSFGLSTSGRKLRTALIGFQYAVSIGLIISAFFIQLQNQYMETYDHGFNKNQVAIVNIGTKLYETSRDVYRQKLKEYPGIEDVAYSFQPIGYSDTYSGDGVNYKEKFVNTLFLDVSWNLLQLLKIPVIEGRDFTEADLSDQSTTYFIYNKRLQQNFDMTAGDRLDNVSGSMLSYYARDKAYIAGFVDNLKISSLRQGEDDISFIVNSGRSLPISYIRMAEGTNVAEAVEHIRQTIATIDPSYPFHIDFYDSYFDQLYKKEDSLNRMVTAFSLLAIILSIVGVFGLVVFETQYRRKEIGIRKVFGATVQSILIKFNGIYFRIICICFVIATPIAYYFVKRWLESFYYRTPIHWWVFIAAFIVVTIITLFTVSFQNWRAATANPTDSIKSE